AGSYPEVSPGCRPSHSHQERHRHCRRSGQPGPGQTVRPRIYRRSSEMSSRGRIESLRVRLARVGHLALDLDGTIYRGGTLFPSTVPFLKLLKQLGIGYTFQTNNSSKSTRDYLIHLQRFGIEATADQLQTSTQATVAYLRDALPGAKRLFILGTTSLIEELHAEG